MKKILVVMMMCFLFVSNVNYVFADESTVETYSYTIDYVSWITKYSNGYFDAKKASGTIESVGRKIAGYRMNDGESVYLALYNSSDISDVIYIYGSMDNVRQYCSTSGTTEAGYMTLDGVFDVEKYPDKYWTSNDLVGQLEWDNSDYLDADNPGYLHASFPVFESLDEVNQFISGEISEKDAINYEDDLSGVVYDLEIPLSIKVTNVDGDVDYGGQLVADDTSFVLIYTWEQEDPNYVNWHTEVYCLEDFRYRDTLLFLKISPWSNVEDFYVFDDSVSSYNLRYSGFAQKYVNAIKKRSVLYGDDVEYDTQKIVVYFRNAYFDSESGIRHYSNWVKLEHDLSSGEHLVSVIEMAGAEFVVTDDGDILQPDSEVVVDSQYAGAGYSNIETMYSSDIVGWIGDGFGFLGDNGVLVLISDGFNFIPYEFWSVMIAGVGVMVMVAIVKFIRG